MSLSRNDGEWLEEWFVILRKKLDVLLSNEAQILERLKVSDFDQARLEVLRKRLKAATDRLAESLTKNS